MFRSLKQAENHDLKSAIIGNSQTVSVGDAIVPGATGHNAAIVGAASTSGYILGVIVGIVGLNGKVLEISTNYAAASNNETVGGISVKYIPSYLDFEFEADLQQAVGTTTNSGGLCWLNMYSVNGQLDETSVALFSGTAGQFWSYGNPSYSTTKVQGHWWKNL